MNKIEDKESVPITYVQFFFKLDEKEANQEVW